MLRSRPISWGGSTAEKPGTPPGRIVAIHAQVGSICLSGELHVAEGLASLADLVPVARQLADELIEQIAIDLHARGRQISCQAGCSACCRYLIPVSPPEALAIWMGLLHLPGPRRERVMSRFLDVMRRIDHNPLPNMTELDENDALQVLSDWYASLDTPCPLLEDNLCSVYAYRPLACRECLTTCSPTYCADPRADVGERVMPPFSLAEVLYETAGIMLAREPESVVLTTLPSWIRTASEPYDESWPAIDVARCFAATLHRHASDASGRLAEEADRRIIAGKGCVR